MATSMQPAPRVRQKKRAITRLFFRFSVHPYDQQWWWLAGALGWTDTARLFFFVLFFVHPSIGLTTTTRNSTKAPPNTCYLPVTGTQRTPFSSLVPVPAFPTVPTVSVVPPPPVSVPPPSAATPSAATLGLGILDA